MGGMRIGRDGGMRNGGEWVNEDWGMSGMRIGGDGWNEGLGENGLE